MENWHQMKHWHERAIESGWRVVERDPHGSTTGPLYFHETLNRVWPLDDPRGAVKDVGDE